MNDVQKKIQEELANLQSSKVATKTDAELRAIDNWINDEDIQRRRREGHSKAHDKISDSLKDAWKNGSFKGRDQSFRQDPEYIEAHKERMKKVHADPMWKENHSKGMEALRNDPERWAEYQENYKKGNTAKYDNPEFWANYYAAIQERDSNPEYHKKRLNASKNKIRKPVRTPLGVFETQTDAMNAHGFKNTEIVRHRCKSNTFPDWQMISIEEYEKHKT